MNRSAFLAGYLRKQASAGGTVLATPGSGEKNDLTQMFEDMQKTQLGGVQAGSGDASKPAPGTNVQSIKFTPNAKGTYALAATGPNPTQKNQLGGVKPLAKVKASKSPADDLDTSAIPKL